MKTIVIMNGRSAEGIIRDAVAAYPAHEVFVLCRDSDALPPPPAFRSGTIEELPEEDDRVVVVANGGTTEQLVGALRRMHKGMFDADVVQIERGGGEVRTLWEIRAPRCHVCGEVSDGPCSQRCAMNTAW